MSTAAAEPDAVVTPSIPLPENWDAVAADGWKAALEATPAPEPAPEPKKEEPKPEGDKPKPDAIPDDLITGKPEEKKSEEEDPDEKILNEVPDGQIRREQFKAAQEAAKRRIAKVAEETAALRKELEAAKAAPKTETNPEELKALREQVQAKEEALERHAFEKSERFQNAFTRKEHAIVEQASAYAKSVGADTDAVEHALKLGGSKAVAALNALDLEPGHQQYLINRVAELDATNSAKAAALTKWNETSKHWRAEEAQAREAQLQQQRENEAKVFDLVSKEIASKYPLIFNKREGNEAWNARLDVDGGKAFTAFKAEMDVNDYAAHQVKGAALDRAYEALVRQRETIESMSAELRELKGASPTINGSKPPEQKPEKRDVYDPMALEKAAQQGWAAAARGG